MEQNAVMEEIKERAVSLIAAKGTEVTAEVVEVLKNNDVKYHGIRFQGKENVQPVIYMDHLVADLESGASTIEAAAEEIAERYFASKWECDLDVSMVLDFENVRDKIVCCVQNRGANEELLKDVPFTELEDLAVCYRIVLMDAGKYASVLVKKQYLTNWGISLEELHNIAWENTRRLYPAKLRSMSEVLGTLLNEAETENRNEERFRMYVLGNSAGHYGAVYIDDKKELLKAATTLGDDLVILPSSIHELILLRATDAEDHRSLRELVSNINQTQVEREDRLSDNIYYFSREDESLRICA